MGSILKKCIFVEMRFSIFAELKISKNFPDIILTAEVFRIRRSKQKKGKSL